MEELTYSTKNKTFIKNIRSEITSIEEKERNGLRMVFLIAYLSIRIEKQCKKNE